MFHQIARTREDRYVLALYTRRSVGVTSGVQAEQASTFATRCRKSAWIHPPHACIHPRSIHPRMRLSIPPSTSVGEAFEGKRLQFTFHHKDVCESLNFQGWAHAHVFFLKFLGRAERELERAERDEMLLGHFRRSFRSRLSDSKQPKALIEAT